MQYDADTLKKINEGVDLLEYASQFMDMKKRGDDYFAHCTLHTDLTPSLSFNPDKNLFYCFSCGKAGGIIQYLRYYEGLSFDEAVKKGAKLASLDLNKLCKSNTISFLKQLKTLMKPHKLAYQHKILPSSELQKYKKERVTEWLDEGIKQEVLDLFGVRVDIWSNRIVYPVYDANGRLINIKARTRYPNYKQLGLPKYINYHEVGVMDYFQGLNVTMPFIKKCGEVIVFESIKSVMKAYGWGYRNCVSAEKHTLTDEQIMLLAKLKANVVFAYDSDVNYWQEETKQNIDKLKRITNVYVIEDRGRLLGGADAKNAPVDLGEDVWTELYQNKRKMI